MRETFFMSIVLLVVVTGCKQRAATSKLNNEAIYLKASVFPEYEMPASDPFRILHANVEEEFLNIRVQYPGGCTVHEFELHRPRVISSEQTSHLQLVLEHDARGDLCESLPVQQLQFNINDKYRHFSLQEIQQMHISVINASTGKAMMAQK